MTEDSDTPATVGHRMSNGFRSLVSESAVPDTGEPPATSTAIEAEGEKATDPSLDPPTEALGSPGEPTTEGGFDGPLNVPDAVPEADGQETIDGWEESESMEGEAPTG